MKLIPLGTGTIVPSLYRSAPAHALFIGDAIVLMDIGPGALRRMKEASLDVSSIDAIAISHFHPDHTADFVPFVFATKYAVGSYRTKDLTIFGPLGFGEFYNGLIEVYGDWIVPEGYKIHIEEMRGDEKKFNGFFVQTAPVNHNPESIAFRFTDGVVSLVYSGDTGWSEDLIDLARGADALLLECSFPDEMKVPGHLTPREAARVASAAGVNTLILTHLYPLVDELDIEKIVREFYGGKLIVAHDLAPVEIGSHSH